VATPEPLVTVAVSTYASERLLGPCLEMLMEQTLGDRLEVIVVDSGSPEDERSVVEPFLATGRVHYLRTERETLYAAWGRALARARGRYFANVNTDDWLAPHSLATLAEALDTHPDCALAYADWAITDTPHTAPRPESAVCVHTRWEPTLHLFYCYTGCVQFWRRSALEALGGHDPNLRYCGDLEVLRRLTEAGMRCVYVPEVLWGFFQNPDGLSLSTDGSTEEQRQVHRRARQAVRIEQFYAVDPADSRAAADAWTALGVLAMRVRVPWLDAPTPDVDFALDCFGRALALVPDHADALHDCDVVLVSAGRRAETKSSLGRLGARRSDGRGTDLELRHAEVEPARRGEVFVPARRP
jgi:hypothetical protein